MGKVRFNLIKCQRCDPPCNFFYKTFQLAKK